MTIRRVRIVRWRLPLRQAFVTSRVQNVGRSGGVLVLETGSGVRGLGEIAPHPHAGESAVGQAIDLLSGASSTLIGGDAGRLLAEMPRWPAAGTALESAPGSSAATLALESALIDLLAREQGVPAFSLLGKGGRSGLAATRLLAIEAAMVSTVNTQRGAAALHAGRVVAVGRPDARARGAESSLAVAAVQAAGEGFSIVKIKVSTPLDALLAIRVVRQAAPGLCLRIDPNGTWSANDVRWFAEEVEPGAVDWLEQPLAPDSKEELPPRLANGLKIALDESVQGVADVDRLGRLAKMSGSPSALVLKAVQVGGLRSLLMCGEMSAAHGLRFALSTGFESSLGVAALLHAGVAMISEPAPSGLSMADWLELDPVQPALPPRAWMVPPPGVGFGVKLDEAVLRRVQVHG